MHVGVHRSRLSLARAQLSGFDISSKGCIVRVRVRALVRVHVRALVRVHVLAQVRMRARASARTRVHVRVSTATCRGRNDPKRQYAELHSMTFLALELTAVHGHCHTPHI